MNDYSTVTELAGEAVSSEQILRMRHRYSWAAPFCKNKNVLEYACGTGQGINILLKAKPKALTVCDIMPSFIRRIKETYGARIVTSTDNFSDLKIRAASLDVIIIFEAIYYLKNFDEFIGFCIHVLKPGGTLLIATTNKDLYDFTPSEFAVRYYGVKELTEQLSKNGFSCQFEGYYPINKLSLYNLVVRPLKFIATRANLIPKTMGGKKFLKSLVFGELTEMPDKLEALNIDSTLEKIQKNTASSSHKVIYCVATKIGSNSKT